MFVGTGVGVFGIIVEASGVSLAAGEQAETVKEMYSRQDGVIIIGNDPNEWFDNRESILDFMKADGSSKLELGGCLVLIVVGGRHFNAI